MVSKKYLNTLEQYLRWKPEGVLFRPTFGLDATGKTAAESMQAWESTGTPLPTNSSEPELLADYVQAKRSRDWHISEWRQGVKEGFIAPYELIGTFGLTWPEVKKLLGTVALGPFPPMERSIVKTTVILKEIKHSMENVMKELPVEVTLESGIGIRLAIVGDNYQDVLRKLADIRFEGNVKSIKVGVAAHSME